MSSLERNLLKTWGIDSLNTIFTAELGDLRPPSCSDDFLRWLTKVASTGISLPEARRGLTAEARDRLAQLRTSSISSHRLMIRDVKRYLKGLASKDTAEKLNGEQKSEPLQAPSTKVSSPLPSSPVAETIVCRPPSQQPQVHSTLHPPATQMSSPSIPSPSGFNSSWEEATMSQSSHPSPSASQASVTTGRPSVARSTPEVTGHTNKRPYDANRFGLEGSIHRKNLELDLAKAKLALAEDYERHTKDDLDAQKKEVHRLLVLAEGGWNPARDSGTCNTLLQSAKAFSYYVNQLRQPEHSHRSDDDLQSAFDAFISAIEAKKNDINEKTQEAENRRQQAETELAKCQAELDSCCDTVRETSNTKTRLEAEIDNLNQEATGLESRAMKKRRGPG